MKKIVLFTLGLLFAFSLAAFGITNRAAHAETGEPNFIVKTNYNQENLLTVEAFDGEGRSYGNLFSHDFDQVSLELSRSYSDINKVNVVINEGAYSEAENFKDEYLSIDGVYINDVLLTFDGSKYIANNLNPLELTEIEIRFEVKAFEITAECRDITKPYIAINGTSDEDFIEFYTVKNEVETKLEKDSDEKYWISYNQELIIKVSEHIMLNDGQVNTSFNYESLYFNQRHNRMLAGSLPSVCLEYEAGEFKCSINSAFLFEYYELIKSIKFLAYYTQNFAYLIDFSDSSFIEGSYKVTSSGNLENGFLKPGTNLQITFKLKDYVQLKKLSDGVRFDIVGLNYALDTVSVHGNDVTINTIVFDRNIDLMINTELARFTVDSENSNNVVIFKSDTFKYGDIVEITAITGGSSEVKSWEINEIKVPNKIGQSENGIKRTASDKVEIDTAEWYKVFGLNFNKFANKVTMGMKSGMLMAIIIPTGAVTAAGVILLFIMFSHSKTKMKIKAILQAEKLTGYTYNTGSMIEDLKADNFNKVTEEDIKAEIKKRKKQDK